MEPNSIAESNQRFWNELCGTIAARSLGITDASSESLKKFDDWYFDFYPFLLPFLAIEQLRGASVLEVGLGYGSVSQVLAAKAGAYQGLDIAEGPVQMVNARLRQENLNGNATTGSILHPPFQNESFDAIVAIGCLHHTGDLELAISRCADLLRPGGRLLLMVYYAYSYRRYWNAPAATLRYLGREFLGYRGVVEQGTARQRAAYDANARGEEAPHTDWISKKSLRALCRNFSRVETRLENIDQERPYQRTPRAELLASRWPRIWGLDLYARAVKR